MSRIFISYKRVDKDKVFKIKDQIESALGEKCWIDLDGIESDAQFANVIINAINNCEVFIFVYSNAHSQIIDYNRDWTIRELNYAQQKSKYIMFVSLDGTELPNWFEFMFPAKQVNHVSTFDSLTLFIDKIRRTLPQNSNPLAETNQIEKDKDIDSTTFRTEPTHQDSLGEYDLFISYSRIDIKRALQIKNDIEKQNKATCWMDIDGIESAAQFEDVIIKAIDNSKAVIFLLSENSMKSQFAKKEVRYANQTKKKLIPVKIDKSEPKGWFLFNFSGIDVIDYSDTIQRQKLMRDLLLWFPHHEEVKVEEKQEADIYIEPDMDCHVQRFHNDIIIAYVGKENLIHLPKGKHKLQFIAVEDESIRKEKQYEVRSTNISDYIEIKFRPVNFKISSIRSQILFFCKNHIIQVVCLILFVLVCITFFTLKKLSICRKDNSFFAGVDSISINTPDSVPKILFKDIYFTLNDSMSISKSIYENASCFSENYASVKENGKWIIIDMYGKKISESRYDSVWAYNSGIAKVMRGGLYGYVDTQGTEIIPLKYDYLSSFTDGLAVAKRFDRYGYIDKEDREIIRINYKTAQSFSEGLACVQKEYDGEHYFIDTKGKVIFSRKRNETTYSFSEGKASAYKDGALWGYIDKKGNYVIQPKYRRASSFSEGLAVVLGDYGYVYCINDKGDIVKSIGNESKGNYCYRFSNGFAKIEQKHLFGFIDKQGREIISAQYQDALYPSDGLFAVKKNGNWGFVDKQDITIIDFQYQEARSFSEGLAAVKKDGKWGYINRLGQSVVDFKYDEASSFSEGSAVVILNEKKSSSTKTWIIVKRSKLQ